MIKILAISFITFSLQASLIGDQLYMCNKLKTDLFKTSRVFRDMTQDDRQRLYSFSMRGVTLNFMKAVTLLDQPLEQKKNQLLKEIEEIRNAFREWKDPGSKNENEMAENIVQKMEIKEKSYTIQGIQFVKMISDLKQNRAELRNLIENMKVEMTEIEEKSKLIKQINESVGFLNTITENNNSLLSILEKIKINIGDTSNMMEEINSLKIMVEDLIFLQSVLMIEADTEEDFQFSKNQNLTLDINNLKKNVETLDKNITKFRKQIQSNLEKQAKALHYEITHLPTYPKFEILLKQSKEIATQLVSAQIEHVKRTGELSISSYTTQTLNLQRLRIDPQEIMDYQMQLIKINKLMSNTPENYDERDYVNPSFKNGILDYFTKNQSRLEELTQLYEEVDYKWQTLNHLIEKEKELDELFALALADLQGGLVNNPEFRCFSILEISVYVYFMNVTQIVVSKQKFYKKFMESLEIEYATMLIKQISKDLEGQPLEDPEIIDTFYFNLVPGGLEKWVSRHAFLSNEDLDKIFEKQIYGIQEEQSSLIQKIMNAAGFTLSLVWQAIKKGSLDLVFKGLAVALVTAFSIVHVSGIVLTFVAAFLAVLTSIFVIWVGEKITGSPWIMKSFNEGKAYILSKFFKKEAEYLDVEDAIIEAGEIQLYKEAQEKKIVVVNNDSTDYYKNLFDRMIEIEDCYDHTETEELLDDIFI